MNQNEAALVAQARSGDPDAWDRLLGGFRLRLYVYARELLHDDASAIAACPKPAASSCIPSDWMDVMTKA